jgi:hypothetical protein
MKNSLPFLCVFLIACSAPPNQPREDTADVIVGWNQRLLGIAEAEDGFLTLKGVRATAIMHLAIHDALSNIDGSYAPYAYDHPNRGADRLAAATQAAFVVAVDQYPDQRAVLQIEHRGWLSQIPDGAARDAGVELGEAAARAVLESRRGDGWDAAAEYRWHPMGPGVYAEFREHSGTPEGFVFGAGWGTARPFALEAHDQYRAPAPPEINSPEYTRAFNEVKEVGRFESATRTADQSHLALWWKDFAESSHNRLARALVVREQLGLLESARLFALLNVAIFDAYVNVFDNKFFYNHWRPYTAIRWAEHDGNPDTEPDADWNNLHRHTYAFPSYPSAHGTACAAAMTVLAETFGGDVSFVMTTKTVDSAGPGSERLVLQPPTRSFGGFSEAALECAMSRVYLGIHFRYDSVEGNRLGNRIGRFITDSKLRPVSANSTEESQ